MVIHYISWLLLLTTTIFVVVVADQNECWEPMSCGEYELPIRFPFRLEHRHPDHCGYPGFHVSCTSTNETQLHLSVNGSTTITFNVISIDYKSQSVEVYTPNICYEELLLINVSGPSNIPPFRLTIPYDQYYQYMLLNCSSSVELMNGRLISCNRNSSYHVFFLSCSYSAADDQFLVSCTKMYNSTDNPNFTLNQVLLFATSYIIELEWSEPTCGACEAQGLICDFKNSSTRNEIACFRKGERTKGLVAGAVVCSFVLVLAIIALMYDIHKNKDDRKNQLRIEKFLEDYRALKPSRYSYADIKKITDQFKDKVGEGAYGTVFKGKLSNDVLVAVKILNNSKGNGEEFVNEVGTMGQIHHVNVVRLVGFCADGFRRALVFEYLPNGSLQKYIASTDPGKKYSLNWETMQDITMGIAKGIEYLHQGCEQRILHFDIKPHNILLDHNFTPKISDFGLAKLCSKDQSLVLMTTARGTVGYIAPEIFSRNFGNVSCKSDVYSFGMLLLEMVGGRKTVDETTENADQVYYPEWIYNLLEDGDDLRIHIDDEGDASIAKKLAIVGLWCIQWHPGDRPSMKAVVQMLEEGDRLTMPPNPFASTGTERMNVNMPTRNVKQALEIILED